MFHQNSYPAISTQCEESVPSPSVTHSAPAPSPNGQCTTVHHNVQDSATPVSFSIFPGQNQDLTIQSVKKFAESQTGEISSSTGPNSEQKGNVNIGDVPLTERSPFRAPDCNVVSESVLPRLYKADYYTLPSIAELAARECQEPGCCSHVKDFTVGRHGYGSVKFDGQTDVRMVDITSIVEFMDREINAYRDESKRPPVGQELNKPAEITLLNACEMRRSEDWVVVNGGVSSRCV